LIDEAPAGLFAALANDLAGLDTWHEEAIETVVKQIAQSKDLKLGKVAQPLRAALTGSNSSPGIFEVMQVLGKPETLNRLKKFEAA
jgi:glutamyl-tRNA synthetase